MGFTPWSGPAGGSLDDDLEQFLDAGDPPVVVTLGTSGASARPEVFAAALDTLDTHHVSGVFLASNDQLAARISARAGTRHAVRAFAPLAALLDRARAIVQSGAHGTNSLALLRGIPSVTMPCLYDQVAHARCLEELGTGVGAKRPRAIEPALGKVLTDTRFRDRARAFAAEIADEDGTAATVNEVESLISRRRC